MPSTAPSPARPSPALQAQEILRAPPGSHAQALGNPFNPSLTTDKMPRSPESLTHPGNSLTHPFNAGNPHPQPKRWSPSRDSTPSPPQESSPTAKRLLRLLHRVAAAGSLHSSAVPAARCRGSSATPAAHRAGRPPAPG